jgi:hypothetical protein
MVHVRLPPSPKVVWVVKEVPQEPKYEVVKV